MRLHTLKELDQTEGTVQLRKRELPPDVDSIRSFTLF